MSTDLEARKSFGRITTYGDKRDFKIKWFMDESISMFIQYQEITNELTWQLESPRFKATPFIATILRNIANETEFRFHWNVCYRVFSTDEPTYKFRLSLCSVINNGNVCSVDLPVKIGINFVDTNGRIVFGFLREMEREELLEARFEAAKKDMLKWGVLSATPRELHITIHLSTDDLEEPLSDTDTIEIGRQRTSSPDSLRNLSSIMADRGEGDNRENVPKRRKLQKWHPFKKLYEDMKYTDVTLKAGSLEIECHKAMLSTASNVLDEALRTTGYKDVLDVTDHLSEDVASHFVEYIYTGKLVDLDFESRIKMNDAAKFYTIHSLRERITIGCENLLNVQTAIRGFQLAIDNGCDLLKEKALRVIFENKKPITETQGYKDMTFEVSKELVTAVLLREN